MKIKLIFVCLLSIFLLSCNSFNENDERACECDYDSSVYKTEYLKSICWYFDSGISRNLQNESIVEFETVCSFSDESVLSSFYENIKDKIELIMNDDSLTEEEILTKLEMLKNYDYGLNDEENILKDIAIDTAYATFSFFIDSNSRGLFSWFKKNTSKIINAVISSCAGSLAAGIVGFAVGGWSVAIPAAIAGGTASAAVAYENDCFALSYKKS